MSEQPNSTTPEKSAGRRGALRFLFRTPLGILCVVVTLLLAALAALPAIASSLAPARAADWFAGRYHGRLEVDRLDLGWTGTQSVKGARLLDPAGATIANVDVELPGLWSIVRSGGKRIGKVVVRGEVALSADDAGRTNLQRALEPRSAAADEATDDSKKGSTDDSKSSGAAGELELELDLQLSRVEWSDARTRAMGQPVRIDGLRAAATLRPGEPIVASLTGQLTGAASGKLDLAAKVVNAFAPPSSATPPSAELRAELRGLPVAWIDGLAGQAGRLSALLGETMDANVQGSGTWQVGALSVDVAAPLARVNGELELRGGVLSTRGDGLRADLTAGPALDGLLNSALGDPSLHVARLPNADPVALRVVLSGVELPVAPWLDAKAAGRADEGLSALIQGARGSLSVTAGGWRVDAKREGAASLALELPELELTARLVEPTQPSVLTLKAVTRAGGPSSVGAAGLTTLELELPGGIGAALRGPRAGIEGLRVRVGCNALPMAALDALAGLQGDLLAVAGESASARITLDATLEQSEDLPASWGAAGAAWRAIVARARVSADVALGGTSTGAPVGRLAGEPLAVHRVDAKLTLASGGPIAIAGSADFATRQQGRIEFDASASGMFGDSAASVPQFAITAKASGLSTAVGDAILRQGPLLQPLLGPGLTLECSAQGGEQSGVARVSITSESSDILATARWADGEIVDLGEPALRISLQPDAEFLAAKWSSYLPEGMHLSFSDSRGAFGLTVPRLSLPFREIQSAIERRALPELKTALDRTRIDVMVAAREFLFSDASMAAAGVGIEGLGLQANLELRPPGAKGGLSFDLSATSPSFGAEPIQLHAEVPDPGALLLGLSADQPQQFSVRLVCRDLTTALLDAYAKGALAAPMGPVLQADLSAVVKTDKASLDGTVDLRLAGSSGESKVAIGARIADMTSPGIPPIDATLDVKGSDTWIAFAPQDLRADLRELLGDAWNARVALNERPAAGDEPRSVAGTVSCNAARLRLDAPLESVANRLRATGPMTLSITPTQAMLDRYVSAALPPGAKLDWEATPTEAERAIELRLSKLDVGLPGPDAPAGFDLAALLRELHVELEAKLPALNYVHPPAVAGQAPTSAPLRDLRLIARLAPNENARVDLTGAVGGDGAGKIEVHADVRKPEGFVDPAAQPYPAAGSSVRVDASLVGFPSALIDALARQEGLLVDVLGPTLDATVQGDYPEGIGDALHAELKSKLGEVRLDSRLQAGVIRSSETQGLDAKVGLTPLFSQRIVGSLLPVLVSVRQDDPGHRTVLSGRNLALPMDGDLTKLSGEIVLDLGAVDYQLLPGLEQAFAIAGARAPEVKNTVIRPITIRIVDGVARYDAIPIKIGGRELSLRGSADLGRKSFELAFNVPLELMGSKVESKLESLRKVLDPKLEVPLELYGSWSSPRIRLGKGFLEKTLKDAAGKALEDELEKGLGDLFGDKKKKKKDG